nr:MAG TPA: hypothetical protein [Caudoviricetes sp.]
MIFFSNKLLRYFSCTQKYNSKYSRNNHNYCCYFVNVVL